MSRMKLDRGGIDLDSLCAELSSATALRLNLVVDYSVTGNEGNGHLIVKDYETDEEVDIDEALLRSKVLAHVPPPFSSPIERLEAALEGADTVPKLRTALRDYVVAEKENRNPMQSTVPLDDQSV